MDRYFIDEQKDAVYSIDILRKEKGLSKSALGLMCDLTRSGISRVLSCESKLSINRLSRILRYLGYRLVAEPIKTLPDGLPENYNEFDHQEDLEVLFDININPKEYKDRRKNNNLDIE